ncbi:MAG: hypothetical protein FWG61_01930 [Firmicutes bacterium]|nr:hypothetical protein [Bacillota bacterium]
MKKLLRNKRMFLTLVAGVLVFVAVLSAGTFAWFTGKDAVKLEGTVTTAAVAVNAQDMEIVSYDFYPGVAMSIANQANLEAIYGTADHQALYENYMINLYGGADPAYLHETDPTMPYPICGWNLNAAKGTFWEDFLTGVYDYDEVPVTPPPFLLRLIKNALSYDTASKDITGVTPGSLIVGDYSFDVLDSNIPVYFRVQAADLVTVDANDQPVAVAYEQMVRTVITGTLIDENAFIAASKPFVEPVPKKTPPFEATLKLGADGYYYCSLPLSPYYAWNVQVKHDIYLYGGANGNDVQNTKLYFANTTGDDELEVEVIQASNNAVYFADEWKDVAGLPGEFFVEYISDAYGMYKFMLEHIYK